MSSAYRFTFMMSVLAVLWLLQTVIYLVTANAYGYAFPHWPWLFLGVSVLFIFANALARMSTNFFVNLFYVGASIWLGVTFLFFSAAFFYQVFRLAGGIKSTELLTACLGIAGIAAVYSLFNARHLTVKEFTVPIKNLEKPLRLVHLSDVHIGTVHQTKFLKRVVALTNEQKPDLILMTGDLFDGSTPIDESILSPINDFEAPIFFSNGNHEEYEGLQKVAETVSHLDMPLLANRVTTWNGIQIIGVDDQGSHPEGVSLKTILNDMPIQSDKPSILMYHTPVEWDVARHFNIDLMLSGHTHNGQIFPFTLLVRLSFKYVKGLFEEGGKYLHVTPGTGTWGPPMRLGSQNQVTLLHLEPKAE